MDNNNPTRPSNWKLLGDFIVLMLISIGLTLFYGWVFKCIFNWFIAPITPLDILTYWEAMGIVVFVDIIRAYAVKINPKKNKPTLYDSLILMFSRATIILILFGFAAIVAVCI